nr:TetR/AcrR family transcriptional regulator [Chthonobacter rhizosphaerae]
MPRDGTSTRERIVAEAGRLFEERGLSQVSLEDVARSAGITKRGLLYHFSKKDDLAAACVTAEQHPTLKRFVEWAGGEDPSLTVRERAERLLLHIGDWIDSGSWSDLGFIRFATELGALPNHPARRLAASGKKAVELWFAKLLAAEGRDPENARLIAVVVDGALVQSLVHRDGSYARDAVRLVSALLPDQPRP